MKEQTKEPQENPEEDYYHGEAVYHGEEFPDFVGDMAKVWDDHSDPMAPCYKIMFKRSNEEIGNIHDEDITFID